MKKTLIYLSAAAILGILVTIVPLLTIAQIGMGENRQNELHASSLNESFGRLEGHYDSNNPALSDSDLTVLAISFIIALVAYTLVKHRAPRRYNFRLGVPPY